MTEVLTWGAGTRGGSAVSTAPAHLSSSFAGGNSWSSARRRTPDSLPLFAAARLIVPWQAEGESLPAGASGTIVEQLDGGRAYIVEFFRPRHCVVTVDDDALVADGP